LEWAAWLRAIGFEDARRGQQFSGGPDSPDVMGGIPGTHAEVKRTEALRIYAAVEQAVREAGKGEVPYVAFRSNREDWLVILRAWDVRAFGEAIKNPRSHEGDTGG
jgi:hypothetical protein